jgi:hypothetical protein
MAVRKTLIQSHVAQWKHNRALLPAIPADYPDWQVVVTFYTALHAVDSVLAYDKVERVTSHDARNRVLFQTNRYLQIQQRYMPLYFLSRTIRYLAEPAKWVPADRVKPDVIERYLYPIEASVQRLMGEDLKLSDIVLSQSVSPPPSAL